MMCAVCSHIDATVVYRATFDAPMCDRCFWAECDFQQAWEAMEREDDLGLSDEVGAWEKD